MAQGQKHCERVEMNDKAVTIVVTAGRKGWMLMIEDDDGNTTAWEDSFATAKDAFAEGRAALDEQGIAFFVGSVDVQKLS